MRTLSGLLSAKVPQVEHSLDEGNHRSTAITSRPYHWALYSSMEQNSLQLASEMARASFRFLTMLRTVRSSITSVWFSVRCGKGSFCSMSRDFFVCGA